MGGTIVIKDIKNFLSTSRRKTYIFCLFFCTFVHNITIISINIAVLNISVVYPIYDQKLHMEKDRVFLVRKEIKKM